MPPQSLVLSLPCSKLLSEKGVKIESYFWWKYQEVNGVGGWIIVETKPEDYGEKFYFPAYTLSEMSAVFRWLAEQKGYGGGNVAFSAHYLEEPSKIPYWQYTFLEFCRLWADNKDSAETFLCLLLK